VFLVPIFYLLLRRKRRRSTCSKNNLCSRSCWRIDRRFHPCYRELPHPEVPAQCRNADNAQERLDGRAHGAFLSVSAAAIVVAGPSGPIPFARTKDIATYERRRRTVADLGPASRVVTTKPV